MQKEKRQNFLRKTGDQIQLILAYFKVIVWMIASESSEVVSL